MEKNYKKIKKEVIIMRKEFYYEDEKGQKTYRKVKIYPDSVYPTKRYEVFYEYKTDDKWVPENGGNHGYEAMLYIPKVFNSDILYITSREEDTEILNEMGYMATNFWTHEIRKCDLLYIIEDFFKKYKRVYIFSDTIEKLNEDKNFYQALFNENELLGTILLEELSKRNIDVSILRPEKIYDKLHTLTDVWDCAIWEIEKEDLWKRLIKTSKKFKYRKNLTEETYLN